MACKRTLTPEEEPDIRIGLRHRDARCADHGALVTLDDRCFGHRAWSRRTWWEVLCSRESRTLVVTHHEAVVAASVIVLARPTSVLASLAVMPACRQRGLGRWLVANAIARSRRIGARWLSLEVDCSNAVALRLYRQERFGTLRRFREEGVKRIEMIRRLGGWRGR